MLVKFHSFFFEAQALLILSTGYASSADFTARVNHPMPGNFAIGRNIKKHVADLTCLPAKPGHIRNLSVRSDTAVRNLANYCVYTVTMIFHSNAPALTDARTDCPN